MAQESTVVNESSTAAKALSRRLDIEDREYNDTEYKDLMKLYEGTLGKISEGEIVKGRVVAIGEPHEIVSNPEVIRAYVGGEIS